jgi:flagellin
MSVINTNVSALVAQGALTANSRAQSTAMQQLSTGLRINGAKDDAAGLAIASKMTSQIRGLDQSVRNANDAISMLQTADGALNNVNDMLQRMREIAVQSSSDTNVSSDRTALNDEFTALKVEIGRVGATTQWNGMNILDGSGALSGGNFTFQIGANDSADQRMTVNIGSVAGSAASTVALTVSGAGLVQTSAAIVPTLGANYTTTVNGKSFTYQVTAADMTGANAAAQGATVAANMASGLSASGILTGSTAVATSATNTLVLTGTTPFSETLKLSTGGTSMVTGNISSQSAAQAAITEVSGALTTVNATRSNLGAGINRLTYTADNLMNISQNASASRSRVQDTDYAKASTELARTQIISQAATAMLAQANQSQQSVLALLK